MTGPIHKEKERESRLRRSRHSDNDESSQSFYRFRSLSPPDLTRSIIEQLDSNTNANSHPQSRGTAEQTRGLLPLSNVSICFVIIKLQDAENIKYFGFVY